MFNLPAQAFANWLNRRKMMNTLRRKAGDLAITVRAEIPQNLGNIVHILNHEGLREWSSFGRLNIWRVEVLPSSHRLLHYIYPDNHIETSRQGLVPDIFLRPIIPPDNNLLMSDWLKTIVPRPVDIAQGVIDWIHEEEEKIINITYSNRTLNSFVLT
jgi:hypothetical protein